MIRKLGKILAVTAVTALPIVWASAQQSPGRLDQRRQSSRYSNRSRSADASRSQRGSSFGSRGGGNYVYRAKPLPDEFNVLLKSSLFSRNHTVIPTERTRPTTRPASPIVLRGVLSEQGHYIANLEDTGPHRVTWLLTGQTVRSNGSRVEEITLDHIIIARSGVRRLITVGEDLDAGTVLAAKDNSASDIAAIP